MYVLPSFLRAYCGECASVPIEMTHRYFEVYARINRPGSRDCGITPHELCGSVLVYMHPF